MSTAPFTVTDLNATLGAYFREHSPMLMEQKVYQPGAFDPARPQLRDIVEREIIWDEKAWGEITFSLNVQDADNNFDDQGDVVEVKGRLMKAFRMRSDFKLKWAGIYRTWLNHIRKTGYTDTRAQGSLRMQMIAFADNIMRGLLAQHEKNLWLKTAMKGEHVSGHTYVQSYGAAADGWAKLIRDAVTAGLIPANQVVAAGGALTAANTYDHYEDMGLAITADMDGDSELFLISATENTDNYNKGFKAGNPGANQLIHDKYKRTRLENRSQTAITPCRELDGEDLSIITPRGGLIYAKNFANEQPQILTSVAEDPTVINVTLIDTVVFGIARHDYLIVNDL